MFFSRFARTNRVMFVLLCAVLFLVSVFAVPSNASAAGIDPFIETSTVTSGAVSVAYGNGVYVVAAFNNIYSANSVYSVTYDDNTATSGSAPIDRTGYHFGYSATILDNTGALVKDGYTFDGWNTRADGSGSSFFGGSSATITGDITLYAQWRQNTATATPVPGAAIPATGDGSIVPLLLSLSLFAIIGFAISCAWFVRKRDGYK